MNVHYYFYINHEIVKQNAKLFENRSLSLSYDNGLIGLYPLLSERVLRYPLLKIS
jgi:hypothetical protein